MGRERAVIFCGDHFELVDDGGGMVIDRELLENWDAASLREAFALACEALARGLNDDEESSG